MSVDPRIMIDAARLAERGTPFVLVTVAATQGSSPRNAGAKMICLADGAALGTIGGGELEQLARETATTCFDQRSSGIKRFELRADANQCCGGVVDVLFECFRPSHRVVVFGAGHVAGELARCLEDAPFERIIVDDRPEWNAADRFVGWRRVNDFKRGIELARETPASTLACVLTYSHDHDFEILCGLLTDPPAFVGLIGSKSKRACFRTRLSAAGIPMDVIDRVQCPIGLGDMGKAPGAVAVSIAGQLLLEAKNLASL